MNLRQCITRNITYTEVTVSYNGESTSYYVYGETNVAKEMKKILKDGKRVGALSFMDDGRISMFSCNQ